MEAIEAIFATIHKLKKKTNEREREQKKKEKKNSECSVVMVKFSGHRISARDSAIPQWRL